MVILKGTHPSNMVTLKSTHQLLLDTRIATEMYSDEIYSECISGL